MATFITHPLIGAGAASLVAVEGERRKRFLLFSAIAQSFPDIDSIAELLPIEASSALAHRGWSHSLVAALLFGALLTRIFLKCRPREHARWWSYWGWFSGMVALHGVIDAFVDSHVGVMMFWPFNFQRLIFPWAPIPDADIAVSALGGPLWYAVSMELLIFAPLYVVLRFALLPAARWSYRTAASAVSWIGLSQEV